MSNENFRSSIVFNDKILSGKAIIYETRISVEFILELLAKSWTYEEILENYPHLTKDDIIACLNYAKDRIKEERVYPIKV